MPESLIPEDALNYIKDKNLQVGFSYKDVWAELEKLVTGWSPEKIARTMAIAFFKARAEGDANFDKEDE